MNIFDPIVTGSLTVRGTTTYQGNQNVVGDLTVDGNIIASQYIVSSSVIYATESFISGSHDFGNSLDDYHKFTGSIYVTGSFQVPAYPSSPVGTTPGQLYFNTGDSNLYRFNGSSWLSGIGVAGTSGT